MSQAYPPVSLTYGGRKKPNPHSVRLITRWRSCGDGVDVRREVNLGLTARGMDQYTQGDGIGVRDYLIPRWDRVWQFPKPVSVEGTPLAYDVELQSGIRLIR